MCTVDASDVHPGRDHLLGALAQERQPARPLDALVAAPLSFVGAAPRQVADFVGRVEPLVAADPAAAAYGPGDIL